MGQGLAVTFINASKTGFNSEDNTRNQEISCQLKVGFRCKHPIETGSQGISIFLLIRKHWLINSYLISESLNNDYCFLSLPIWFLLEYDPNYQVNYITAGPLVSLMVPGEQEHT